MLARLHMQQTRKHFVKHYKWAKTTYCQQFLTKYRFHTLKYYFTKPPVFVSPFSRRGKKGKYRGTLLGTKGWVNHELTLPREHHHLFTRCQTQWVETGFSRCAAKEHFSQCSYPNVSLCVTEESLSSTSPLTLCCLFGLLWPPCRSELEEKQLRSSWWSYSPTLPTRCPSLPCMENQLVNHWPSRESPVCSHWVDSINAVHI